MKNTKLPLMPASKNNPSKRVFKFIAILLPFLLLVIIELFLRLFGYGNDLSVFVEDKSNKNFLHLNKEVSKKYFTLADNATFGNQELFQKNKDDNTFRIFVLGASTAVGFPYYHNGSFARMLQYRLQRTFPNKNFEIINLSLTAINSYTLIDFAKAVSHQQPDAVFFYEGHNEYYGALGVGSTSKVGQNPVFIRTVIYLKNFRLVQLLFNISAKIHRGKSGISDQRENLMRRMAANQAIIYNSDIYNAGIKQFSSNLDRILSIFAEKKIPVFLSTIVSNEKDLKPMVSIHANSSSLGTDWEKTFNRAENAMQNADTTTAILLFDQLNKQDSSYALTNYYMGKLALAKNNFEEAKKYFKNSKELDALRFRGPEKINDIIREKAGKFKNVILVDTKQKFEDYTPCHIIGSELILEHLHPNLTGYFLMSDAFYTALKHSKILSSNWSNEITASKTYKELPLTPVDSLYGLYGTWLLKEGWPFNEPIPADEKRERTFEEKLAGGLVTRQIKWGEAMNALFDYYIKEKNYNGALKITEALILEFPYDVRLYERAAKIADELNNTELAVYYGNKGFRLSPNFSFAKALFINYLKLDQPEKGLPYIDYAITHNNSQVNFAPLRNITREIIELENKLKTDSLNIGLSNQIASNYLTIGNYHVASKYITKNLSIQPENKDAKKLKDILLKETLTKN